MTTVEQLKKWLDTQPDDMSLSITERGPWWEICQYLTVGISSDPAHQIFIDTRTSDDAGDDI